MKTASTTHPSRSTDGAAAGFDIQRIRSDFPILQRRLNGHPLVYLDNAATAQKPQVVIDRITEYYATENANIHRGVHTLSVTATQDYEQTRSRVQGFLNAPRAEELIFVRGATEAINLVAQSYGRSTLERDDEIIISTMEHHSNIVPWQLVCEQTGARLRVVPISDAGEFLFDAYQDMLTDRTKIVAVAHISNALGTINPIREITEAAHGVGAVVMVDGAQAAPHCAIDLQHLGCDFYAITGHKMFGPTGIGVLFGRHELLDQMPPYQGGGEMILSVTFDETVYNTVPHKFEAGTPNIAGAIALGTAIEYLNRIGMNAIADYEQQLLNYATAQLSAIPQVTLIGVAPHKAAILSFVVEGVHAHDVGTILDQQGVAVRTGHHCAQPIIDRFGLDGTTRASLAFYNTPGDIDALISGLHQVIEVFGR